MRVGGVAAGELGTRSLQQPLDGFDVEPAHDGEVFVAAAAGECSTHGVQGTVPPDQGRQGRLSHHRQVVELALVQVPEHAFATILR